MLKIRIPPFFTVLSLILISCMGNQKDKQILNDPPTIPITEKSMENDELAKDFGLFMEESIYQNNSDEYLSKLDYKRFMELVTFSTYRHPKEDEFRRGFANGFKKGLYELPNRIYATLEQGGFYDYLNYSYDATEKRYKVLFRLFSEVEGINYHQYHLVKNGDEFLFEDIFIYVTGENLSATSHRMYLESLPKNIFKQILNPRDSKDLENFVQAVRAMKEGNNNNALVSLNKIEGDLKKDKIYHVLRLSVSSQLEEGLYMDTLNDMRNSFGDDPTMNLLSLDYFILNGEYDKSLEILSEIEDATSDDFVNYLKGNVRQLEGDHENAILYYDMIIENYPDYSTAFTNKIVSLNLLGRFKECLTTMDLLVDRELVYLEDLVSFVEELDEAGENVLSPLANSTAYKEWKNEKQLN